MSEKGQVALCVGLDVRHEGWGGMFTLVKELHHMITQRNLRLFAVKWERETCGA